MREFVVFYHLAQIGPNWKAIYSEQMEVFKQSGLLDQALCTFLCYTGQEEFPFVPPNVVLKKYREYPVHEAQTLRFLKAFCDKLSFNIPILYIHSKGVTAHLREPGVFENTVLWRRYLESKTVLNREECLDALLEYDHCGPLYSRNFITAYHYKDKTTYVEKEMPFYHGNFWWANSDHIKKLSYESMTSRGGVTTKHGITLGPEEKTCQELWVAQKGKGKNFGSYMFTALGVYTSDWGKPEPSYIHIEPIQVGQDLEALFKNKDIHWLYLPFRDITEEEMKRVKDNTEVKIGNILFRNIHPWYWTEDELLHLDGFKGGIEVL